MILFIKDWRHYPKAIVDTKTKNDSFLTLAAKYRSMGIRHWYFILALHNPELQGLDPFDPNLTIDQKLAIAHECKTNPWYFFREVARVPAMAGSIEPGFYKASRGNIAFYWCFFNHITPILIQPRQTGKTFTADFLSLYIIDIAGNNTKMFMLTKGTDLQTQAISRIKEMRELLPKYIYQRDAKDSDNKTGLNNTRLNNEYLTGVARSNKMAANNLGRGLTVPIVHVDEAPFITWIGTTLPALRAAGTAARDIAASHGAMWGTIFTTTAGRRDDRDAGYMYDFVSKAMPWNEVIFDCVSQQDASRMVDANSRVNAVNLTFSHRQLGKSDAWLYNAIREANGTREEAERDFLNIWNSGSSRSPLSPEILQKIHASMKSDPSMTDVTNQNYLIRWYINENELAYLKKNSKIIMGLDTSEAAGRDAIAMVMMDAASLAVVGAATIKIANLIEFAKWLTSFMIEHVEVILIPERKSTGAMIIDMLLMLLPQAGIDPFKRIYNTIVDRARDSRKDEEAFEELHTPMSNRDDYFYTERKSCFGFSTDKPKRDLLYGNMLQNVARQAGTVVHDPVLIDEIMGLSEKNGRIDHKALGHDDHVFSWLMAYWMCSAATNLAYYGITPGLVMSALPTSKDEDKTVSDQWKEHLQRSYLTEIEELIEKLSDSDNETLTALYENRLRYLSRKVESSGIVKDFSVDGILDRVRKEREKKQRIGFATGYQDEDSAMHSELLGMIDQARANHFRGNMFGRFH